MLIANKYKIYTASPVYDSSTGCGITSQNARCSIKLLENTSTFSAAIMIVTEEATVNDRHNVIFTYSVSVLNALDIDTKPLQPYGIIIKRQVDRILLDTRV